MHQSTTPSLSQTIWPGWASTQFLSLPIAQTLLPVTFGYSLSSEAVVMRQLRRWKRLWRRSLTRSHKKISMGPSKSCLNGKTRSLQPEEFTSKGTRVSCVYYQWKRPYENSLETYLKSSYIYIYIYIYIYNWKKSSTDRLPSRLELQNTLNATSVLDTTLNNLMVRFQLCWSFGGCDESMGQIELNCVLMINWIVWNRTVYYYKNGLGIKECTVVDMP